MLHLSIAVIKSDLNVDSSKVNEQIAGNWHEDISIVFHYTSSNKSEKEL